MNTMSMADVERELRTEAATAGIPIPIDRVIPDDGRFLRYGRQGKRAYDDACFARLGIGFSGRPFGVAGCLATDLRLRVPRVRGRLLNVDPAERRRLARVYAVSRRRVEALQSEQHRIGTERWTAQWDTATPCESLPAHAYPACKGEVLSGCRVRKDGVLLIPRADVNGTMVGGQRIWPKRDDSGKFPKKYSSGTPTKATFYLLGALGPGRTIVVCEGALTGATLHRLLRHATACAMDCNNLLAVCLVLHAQYPHADIVVAGDDDRTSASNPGRTKAVEAASVVGGRYFFPELCRCCNCTDFNDQASCERRRDGKL